MKHTPEKVQSWLKRISGHEGGFTKNPRDPGNWTGGKVNRGELKGTKWGIAANTYGHLDIANLTVEQAEEIYRTDFLAKLKFDQLEDGVVFQLLDFAINSGISRAVMAVQTICRVKVDGIIGPQTVEAVQKISESDFIKLLLAERLEFMTNLDGWDDFGRGWARRLATNLRFGAEDS